METGKKTSVIHVRGLWYNNLWDFIRQQKKLYAKLKQKWNHPNLRSVRELSTMTYPSAYITSSMSFFVVPLLNVVAIVIVEAIVIDL